MFKRCLSSIVAFVLMCSFATGIPQQAMAVEFEPMVASDALVNVLKTMEGFSAKPYWDYAQWTVGYGTRCPDDKLEEYKKNGISKAAAEKLLKKELAKAENAVNNFAVENDRQFEQHEFDALISFTYNCGTGWTSETTGYFYNAVKSGDKGNDFLYAMALWSTAGGEFILIDRRMCEADMYINGIYNAPNAGEEKPYSDNFRWVFLDGNGGDVQYRIYAYDANDPVTLSSVSDKKMFSRKPMGEDKKGNAFTYTLAGWYTEEGKKVTTLNESVAKGQVLYAKWKDPEGNIVEIPKGQPPETDKVVVTGDVVNVRKGPGTYYTKVGEVTKDTVLTISEVYTGNDHVWGKSSIGWISLTYTNYGKMPVITKQSVNAVVQEGSEARIALEAVGTDLQYQWYYKNAGAKKYLLTESFTGNIYYVDMNASRTGRQVYCVITDRYGNSVRSDTVTLGMKLRVNVQPVTTGTPLGKKVVATVGATGDDLSYKWYYKNKGAKKYALTTSFTSNTYWVTMDETRAGRQIYCVVTDKYGNSVKTDTVTLGLGATVLKQPKSVKVANGKSLKISVSAVGDGLTYKWYFKNKGASKFSLTKTFTGSTYQVVMSEERAGRQVYCVITDSYGNSVKTDTVTLGMKVSVVKQPKSVRVAGGKTAKVTVFAVGDGLTYKWYYKNKSAKKFSLTKSFSDESYWVTMNETRADRQVYCVVSDKYGNKVQTDTVTLKMK